MPKKAYNSRAKDNMFNINYQTKAKRIKLLAHPERLKILNALRYDSECVCHLEALLGKPQYYISKQLSILRKAGLIEDRKEGLNVYYQLVDTEIIEWLDLILGTIEPEHLTMAPYKKHIICPCPKCATELT